MKCWCTGIVIDIFAITIGDSKKETPISKTLRQGQNSNGGRERKHSVILIK